MKKLLFLFISLFLFSCEEEPPEAIETYSLQVTVNPEEGGTVTPTSGTFNENEQVSIKASPSPEYVFSDWTGSTSSQSNPLNVIMNSDKSLVANFNKRTYPLTINIEGEGTVSETSQSFESGSEVTLTALPEQGWEFVEWKGDITSTDNPLTIVVNSSKEITAVFEKLNLLSLIINGQGVIEKRVDGELTEDSLFSTGTTIELTAMPSENWEFKEWKNDIFDNPLSLEITKDTVLEVVFKSPVEVYQNYIEITSPNQKTEDIAFTFFNPSGTFTFGDDDNMYAYYCGSTGTYPFGEEVGLVEEIPSQIIKKEGDKWVYHKTDFEGKFWGIRNFEIIDDIIVIGDGNEYGVDASDWKGNAFIGQLNNDGNINWIKVNKPEEMGYFHGTCAGDINGDGLIDVGVTPGIGHAGINLFIQQSDGSFERKDELKSEDFNLFSAPFAIDFNDLDDDGIDEIITADYGGGNIPDENDHEIRIFKYDPSIDKFKQHFVINEPDIYDWGLGATSIQVHDFNNDGIKDIAVAREDFGENNGPIHAFEVWRGIGDSKFEIMFSSPTYNYDELVFREFEVIDAENDGDLDIILIANHGNLLRPSSFSIRLNPIIWINNGFGQFNTYDEKDLFIEEVLVHHVFPYKQNGNLHFVGNQSYDQTTPFIMTTDFKINF